MSDMNINDIRRLDGGLLLVFRELLRRRQTTQVAKRLGLSQSAISHALSRLRDLFGDPLFVRLPHGLEPTPRALELGPKIDALIDLTRQTFGRESGFDPVRSERRFNVSAPEFVTALFGGRLLKALRRAAPHASCMIRHLPHSSALDALDRGEIDIAIGRFGALPNGIVGETLFEDRYCVVARRGHPELKGTIDLQAYARIGHVVAILPTEGMVGESLPEPALMTIAGLVPGWLSALLMVSQTDTIATCPLRLAQQQARLLHLQVIKADFLQIPVSVLVARRSENQDSGRAWFLDQVRKTMK